MFIWMKYHTMLNSMKYYKMFKNSKYYKMLHIAINLTARDKIQIRTKTRACHKLLKTEIA